MGEGWGEGLAKEFGCASAGKESACNAGDLGLIPGLGRSPREGKGYPFQYSSLEKSTDCIISLTHLYKDEVNRINLPPGG